MATLQELLEDFDLFPDWESKYTYLIDLGKNLPPYPEDQRDEAHQVKGCVSQVWLHHEWKDDKLQLWMDSDALIVKGLCSVLRSAYHGKSKADVAAVDIEAAFKQIGLDQQLSPNRRNGFASMVTKIRGLG